MFTAIGAAVLIVASGDFVFWQPTAQASHAGGADAFSIDMDPTGNTATSIGTVQDCSRINKNGVQDADEDAVDTVFADVVALNIPVTHPIIAFEVTVRHGTGLYLDNADFSQMLTANSGSALTFAEVSRPAADNTVLRAHDAQDPYSVTAESGSGVLVRLAWRATAVGPSLQPLTLRASGHIDPNNDAFPPDNAFDADPGSSLDYWILPGSRIAVDQPCPPPVGPTDMEVSDLQISVPSRIYAGEPFSFQAITTLTNLGSASIAQHLVKTPVTLFSACTYDRESIIAGPPVPAGESVSVISTWTTTCNAPETVGVIGYAAAIVLDSVDTELGNNVLRLSPTSFTVLPNDPDGDGVGGSTDLCAETEPGAAVDGRGCSLAQVDSDGDGVCNPDAPSNGPSPGCVRSVAVGGIMGLLELAERPRLSSAEEPSRPIPTVAIVTGGLGVLGLGALYIRRVRR